MKVSSPVGDFPFEAHELRLENGNLVVHGAMGAWPARVEVGLDDVPQLVRLVPAPLLAGAAAVIVAILARLLSSGRSSRGRPS